MRENVCVAKTTGVAVVVAAVLAAVGGQSVAVAAPTQAEIPVGSVALVGSASVTQDSANHWYTITAKNGQCLCPSKKNPAIPPKSSKQGKKYMRQTMKKLILIPAIQQESASLGVAAPSDAEIDRQLQLVKKDFFGGNNSQFQHFLASSGMTLGDVKSRISIGLLEKALVKKELQGDYSYFATDKDGQKQFASDFAKKWKENTVCVDGYIISSCSNSY